MTTVARLHTVTPLTPGIFTVDSPHGVFYGFEVMCRYESPKVPFDIFTSRFVLSHNWNKLDITIFWLKLERAKVGRYVISNYQLSQKWHIIDITIIYLFCMAEVGMC